MQTTGGTTGGGAGGGAAAPSAEEKKWLDEMLADPDVAADQKQNLRDNWANVEPAERKRFYDEYRAAKKGGKKKGGGDKGSLLPRLAPATIVVELPRDAKLTIDDVPTVSTAPRRTFVSPSLVAGREYRYTLKAELTRDGGPQVVTKQVTVRAGQESQVTMEFPAAVVRK
jgi:uncharacterized protein (TIGR03000 family)